MFYTVYKTTNLINGKFYIGTHKTNDPNDNYLGSGTLLRRAIEKYGRDNFRKDVLFIFDNPADMFAKEAELVNEGSLVENNTYNLKLGGHGGFEHINQCKNTLTLRNRKIAASRTYQEPRQILASKLVGQTFGASNLVGNRRDWTGLTHTEAAKSKISKAAALMVGEKNSQFGTMWITNGSLNDKIKKGNPVPNGWSLGRTL